MKATITVIHITWWSLLRILFLFFHWQRPKRPQSLFFFYTHVTRFSVGVCISRQAELLANDLSHSVLRLWFHCYLRALLPPGPHGGKARVPNPSVTISVSNELNWWENLWLVGKAISNNRSISFAACTRCTWCYYRLLDTGSGYPCINVCSGRGLSIVEIQAI